MKIIQKINLVGVFAATLASAISVGAFPMTVHSYVEYGSGTSPGGGLPHGFEMTVSGTSLGAAYAPQAIASWLKPGSGLTGFQTFCLEKNEGALGVVSGNLNTAAINGGISGGNPDPISRATAWLYSQFGHGVLTGYDYDTLAGRDASALALQQAIWFLEGEIVNPFSGVTFVDLAMANVLNPLGDANTDFGVRVINTYDANGGVRQDMLTLVPDGGMSIALLGFALTALGICGRVNVFGRKS